MLKKEKGQLDWDEALSLDNADFTVDIPGESASQTEDAAKAMEEIISTPVDAPKYEPDEVLTLDGLDDLFDDEPEAIPEISTSVREEELSLELDDILETPTVQTVEAPTVQTVEAPQTVETPAPAQPQVAVEVIPPVQTETPSEVKAEIPRDVKQDIEEFLEPIGDDLNLDEDLFIEEPANPTPVEKVEAVQPAPTPKAAPAPTPAPVTPPVAEAVEKPQPQPAKSVAGSKVNSAANTVLNNLQGEVMNIPLNRIEFDDAVPAKENIARYKDGKFIIEGFINIPVKIVEVSDEDMKALKADHIFKTQELSTEQKTSILEYELENIEVVKRVFGTDDIAALNGMSSTEFSEYIGPKLSPDARAVLYKVMQDNHIEEAPQHVLELLAENEHPSEIEVLKLFLAEYMK